MPRLTQSDAIAKLQSELGELKTATQAMRTELDLAKLLELRDLVSRLDERVKALDDAKKEADRRSWQLVYLGVGAILALLGGVIVQLVAFGLRK